MEDLCLASDGCVQQDGHYDVTMSNPTGGYSGDGYRVRIAQVGTDRVRCSDDFYLVSSEDVPGPGEEGGPVMLVVEPSANAIAVAGDMYTVEVSNLFETVKLSVTPNTYSSSPTVTLDSAQGG